MASYTGDFELRRLAVKFARAVSAGGPEDADWITFHFAKLTSGAPDANWLTADYTAVEARFDTWWTTIKPKYPAQTQLIEYRWYKDGPTWSPTDRADGPTNPAQRVTVRAVVGTSANAQMPSQLALTMTEHVGIEKRRGRFYMPVPAQGWFAADGRPDTVNLGFLAATVTLYNGCRADGKQPVVFSRGRSAYTGRRGTLIAAHAATAYEITELQLDNTWDVMRSRRFAFPTLRSRTTLT